MIGPMLPARSTAASETAVRSVARFSVTAGFVTVSVRDPDLDRGSRGRRRGPAPVARRDGRSWPRGAPTPGRPAAAGPCREPGKLVRDTVRPPPVGRVSVRRAAKTVRLSWVPPRATLVASAAIGSRSGSRILTVTKPAVTLNRRDAAHRRLPRGGRPRRQHQPGSQRSRSTACADWPSRPPPAPL